MHRRAISKLANVYIYKITTCKCTYINICIYIYSAHIYMCIYSNQFICIYIYIYAYVCLHKYISIYIYIYINTYIYIIYIYTLLYIFAWLATQPPGPPRRPRCPNVHLLGHLHDSPRMGAMYLCLCRLACRPPRCRPPRGLGGGEGGAGKPKAPTGYTKPQQTIQSPRRNTQRPNSLATDNTKT